MIPEANQVGLVRVHLVAGGGSGILIPQHPLIEGVFQTPTPQATERFPHPVHVIVFFLWLVEPALISSTG